MRLFWSFIVNSLAAGQCPKATDRKDILFGEEGRRKLVTRMKIPRNNACQSSLGAECFVRVAIVALIMRQ